MAKIRNRSGMDLDVPGRGEVAADGVLEVPDEDVYSYTASANWEPVDKDATTAHNKGERAEARAVKGETKAAEENPAVASGVPTDG